MSFASEFGQKARPAPTEFVHCTNRRKRLWGYAGAVIDRTYFIQLRQASGIWRQLVMWLAGFGCLVCLSGLLLGIWAWRNRTRRRRTGGSVSSYRGWYHWHHLLGLAFGLVAFTWLFSGLLSLGPFNWTASHSSRISPHAQVAGGALPALPTQSIASLADQCDLPDDIRLIEWHPINGQNGYRLYTATGETVWAANQDKCTIKRLLYNQVQTLLAASPERTLVELTTLHEYDAYYRPQRRDLLTDNPPRLPVYRARYDDGSWVYFNPFRAEIVASFNRRQRIQRWLDQGLHDLDLPPLAPGGALWHVVILIALTGGTLLSTTST